MDIQTIQAIGTLVSQIGFPATVSLILVLAAWQLLPVLADYLRSKIRTEHATANSIEQKVNGIH